MHKPLGQPQKSNVIMSKLSKTIATIALFSTLQTGTVQGQTDKTDGTLQIPKTEQVDKLQDKTNAFVFATANISKYYPDMKEHLTIMLNSFRDQEHKDSTLTLINTMVKNISDPEQKTGMIIGALEYSVFYKSKFGDKYGDKISEENFRYIEKFDTEYKARFKVYYAKLLTKTEELKKEILKKQDELKQKDNELKQKDNELKQKDNELKQKDNELKQGLQELENTMGKFSSEDVKNNAGIKKLTLETEVFYKEGGFPVSPHLQSLFDASH